MMPGPLLLPVCVIDDEPSRTSESAAPSPMVIVVALPVHVTLLIVSSAPVTFAAIVIVPLPVPVTRYDPACEIVTVWLAVYSASNDHAAPAVASARLNSTFLQALDFPSNIELAIPPTS